MLLIKKLEIEKTKATILYQLKIGSRLLKNYVNKKSWVILIFVNIFENGTTIENTLWDLATFIGYVDIRSGIYAFGSFIAQSMSKVPIKSEFGQNYHLIAWKNKWFLEFYILFMTSIHEFIFTNLWVFFNTIWWIWLC
jgi:hypothetical protein